MTLQSPVSAEKATQGQPGLAPPRLESLLRALNRLKSDISSVEARHPGLGSELSSLCQTAIAELNKSDSPAEDTPQVALESPGIDMGEPADMPAPVPTARPESNLISSAIDKAGSCLITGLDKTGDGIIFILEKLFTHHLTKGSNGSQAEADLSKL